MIRVPFYLSTGQIVANGTRACVTFDFVSLDGLLPHWGQIEGSADVLSRAAADGLPTLRFLGIEARLPVLDYSDRHLKVASANLFRALAS
jgi:hypothetical protein